MIPEHLQFEGTRELVGPTDEHRCPLRDQTLDEILEDYDRDWFFAPYVGSADGQRVRR